MPELPEVEAVVRKLKRDATGARIVSFRALRERVTHPQDPWEVERASGCLVRRVERRGKNIVLRLDHGLALHVHLRMTGNFLVIPDHRLHTHTVRAVFELEDGRGLVLDDSRLLGHVHIGTDDEIEKAIGGVGVDPLSDAFTPEFLIAAAKRSRKPAKVFLMDQKPVCGLGNIYAAEALFRARIHPARPIGELRRARLIALHAAIRDALNAALPQAVRSYREPGRHDGMSYFVYDRQGEACLVCGKPIARFEQGGRSTYWCRVCQRARGL